MKRRRWKFKANLPGDAGRRKNAVAVVAILALAWVVLGGNKGLLALASGWQETRMLKKEIASLRLANEQLALDKKRLQKDPRQYERVAREKLMLAKPGELIYRFDPGEGG